MVSDPDARRMRWLLIRRDGPGSGIVCPSVSMPSIAFPHLGCGNGSPCHPRPNTRFGPTSSGGRVDAGRILGMLGTESRWAS